MGRARRRSPDLAGTKVSWNAGDLRSSQVRGQRPAHSGFAVTTSTWPNDRDYSTAPIASHNGSRFFSVMPATLMRPPETTM